MLKHEYQLAFLKRVQDLSKEATPRGEGCLSGLISAFHPTTLGSSSKHTIYAFSCIVLFAKYLSCIVKSTKINKKRQGLAHREAY